MRAFYIILAMLIQFLVAWAQYNLKIGARRLDFKRGAVYNIKNLNLYFAVALFLLVTILSILVMRFMEFSVFYSFTALNYMFIMFFSWKMFKEKFDRFRIIGNVLVIIGVIVFNLK
jgi:small multidrug resistance pump